MAYATVTLTGTYQTPDGTAHKGHVEIIPSERVIKDTTGDIILTGRVKVDLDAQGAFSVVLPATDDPTLNPTGFGYTIAAKLHSSHPPAVSFSLPAALGATTVEDLTPVDPSTFAPTTTYAEKTELDAVAATIPTTAADVNALPDTTQIPSTAADVGALPDTTTPGDIGAEPAGLSQTTNDTLNTTYDRRENPKVRDAFARFFSNLYGIQPAVWLNIGDSASSHTWDWPEKIARRLADLFATHSGAIAYHNGTAWQTPTNITEGGATYFTIANAAVAGYSSADWLTRMDSVKASHSNPDIITITLGHNDAVAGTGQADYEALVDDVKARYPDTPIVLVVENPNQANNDQDVRRAYIIAKAAREGITATDVVWWALGGPNPSTALYTDNVHLTTPGIAAWTNALLREIGVSTDETLLDTGSRGIPSASLLNGWTVGGGNHFVIRRTGNVVTLTVHAATGGSATDTLIYTLPKGFRPKTASNNQPVLCAKVTDNSVAVGFVTWDGKVKAPAFGAGNSFHMQAAWHTTDPFPTTLPGSAV